MNSKLERCLVVGVEELSLEKSQVGRTPVKEGKNLPNSVTEDIGGFSLMPRYSAKQLREINRRQIAGFKRGTHIMSCRTWRK